MVSPLVPTEMVPQFPPVISAQLSDIIYAVQGYISPSVPGTSNSETLQQVYNLFQRNIVLSYPGNPNGFLAGTPFQFCFDTANNILYNCILGGNASTAVWTKSITLTGGSGITIEQNGENIIISADEIGITWNQVTVNTTMVSGNGYQINTGSNINLLLPPVSSFGDEIEIVGFGGGLWTITQGTGQSVSVGAANSTIGTSGSVAATTGSDGIILTCMQDNLLWANVSAPQGRLSIT